MSKHTPGSWRLGPQHKDKSFAIHAEKASVMRLVPFGSSITEAEANARLMAAAPDLLAALRELADVSRSYIAHMDADDIAALDRARAALSKVQP